MSKKDKRLFFLLVLITTILLSLVCNEIWFRCRYGRYIKQTYNLSIEAVEALERLDSTYIVN